MPAARRRIALIVAVLSAVPTSPRFTLEQRIRYRFDNTLSLGIWAVLLWPIGYRTASGVADLLSMGNGIRLDPLKDKSIAFAPGDAPC